jgi:hypothetical protein
MILRVIRGRVAAGRETDFVETCRQTVADRARAPGLVSFLPGYRRVDGTDRFILVAMWETAEHAARSAGTPENPTVASVLSGVAEVDSLDVYDGLEPIFRGLVDAPGGVIRVTTAAVNPGRRDDVLAWLGGGSRASSQRLVLGWAIGERTVDGREQMIGVSAWPSPLVIEALSDPGRPGGLLFSGTEDYLSNVVVEQYQAIALDLPAELADLGARRVLGARFGTREPADSAAQALVQALPSASEAPVSVAPLGAPGTASDVRSWILVVRVSTSDYPRAERLIADHGGEVIVTTRETESSAARPADAVAEGGQAAWSASPAN